jgi:hypothetical protein
VTLEVPGYRLRARVAERPGGEVYRAEQVGRPGHLLTVEHLRTDPSVRGALGHRLERRRGCRHPNLLPVLDVVATGTGVAIVSPTTPGGSLADALARAPNGLPATVVAAVGARIAAALQALHDQGTAVGAIPLEDVRFDADGRPLLAGLAPRGDAVPADDVQALGAVLAAALLGGPPATAPDPSHGLADAPPEEPVRGSPQLRARRAVLSAIAQATARDGTDGPGSAAELADLLDRAGRHAVDTRAIGDDHEGAARADHERDTSATSGTSHTSATSDASAGQEPRAHASPRGHRPHRPVRRAVVLAALVLSVAGATLVLRPGGGDAPGPTATPVRTPVSLLPTPPAPICEGLTPPEGDGALLLADLDGQRCATPIRWDGGALSVAMTDGPPRRLLLDADPADQLLTADLGCRGQDALVLYRPGSGEVFVLDRLAAPGEEVEVTGQPSGGVGGHATVHPGVDGCDRIVVVGPG